MREEGDGALQVLTASPGGSPRSLLDKGKEKERKSSLAPGDDHRAYRRPLPWPFGLGHVVGTLSSVVTGDKLSVYINLHKR